MQTFVITWYKNERYGKPIERRTSIQVTSSADIGHSAKRVVDIFCSTFGNLKRNTIISVQEMKNGEPYGEPIVPSDETSIVPTRK